MMISMEYQKIINFLDSTTNQTSKYRTNTCVEINDNTKMLEKIYDAADQVNLKLQC